MKNRQFSRIPFVLIIIIFSLLLTAGGGGSRWKTVRVEAGNTFRYLTHSSLKLHNGQPNLAYGSDHLYYATLEDGDFTVSTVDSNWGVGMFASLALDPASGEPRISYYDATREHLKYAERSTNGWTQTWSITVVDDSQVDPGGNKTAITLDNSLYHYPHIAYTKLDGHVWHAWKSCTGIPPLQVCSWHTEEVDDTVDAIGIDISLAIDGNNHLHMAYYDFTTGTLHYAYYDGNWSYGAIYDDTGASEYGREPDLVIDSSNRPAITYEADDGINYAWKTGDNWSDWDFDVVYNDATALEAAESPSVQLPNAGDATEPWISFIDGDSKVELAVPGDNSCPGTTGSYDCTYVDDSTDFRYTSLVVDTTNPAYDLGRVATVDEMTGQLRYEHLETDSLWYNQVVDQSSNIGLYSSLWVDADGPHIGAYDQDQTRFRFSEYDDDPMDCGEYGSGDWYRCTTVVNTGGVPASIDVAVTSNGYRHMALYDPTFPVLQYATDYPTWISSVIDNSSANVGRYASLGISPLTGRAVIAYMDSANGLLKVATELPSPSGTGCVTDYWQCDTIETIGLNGFGISLAFDYHGYPIISYVDGTDHILKMASFRGAVPGGTTCVSEFWNCESTTGLGPVMPTQMGDTSIWGDPSSPAYRISWYNSAAATLMLTSWTPSSGWVTETVDQSMRTGSDNDLTVIGSMPVIAYVNDYWQDLMLAYRVGGGSGNCGEDLNWYCDVMDSAGAVGYSPSIRNYEGRLYISYYDWTNGDLKLMYQAFPTFVPIIRKP